ncbi:hypothetical protein GGR50DRAFT_701958 [Xylaria sp. CBS 124048]|nr:hypothetical protein GGR50DRAFT_701958 [Xylaria sp. CBS 124048]
MSAVKDTKVPAWVRASVQYLSPLSIREKRKTASNTAHGTDDATSAAEGLPRPPTSDLKNKSTEPGTAPGGGFASTMHYFSPVLTIREKKPLINNPTTTMATTMATATATATATTTTTNKDDSVNTTEEGTSSSRSPSARIALKNKYVTLRDYLASKGIGLGTSASVGAGAGAGAAKMRAEMEMAEKDPRLTARNLSKFNKDDMRSMIAFSDSSDEDDVLAEVDVSDGETLSGGRGRGHGSAQGAAQEAEAEALAQIPTEKVDLVKGWTDDQTARYWEVQDELMKELPYEEFGTIYEGNPVKSWINSATTEEMRDEREDAVFDVIWPCDDELMAARHPHYDAEEDGPYDDWLKYQMWDGRCPYDDDDYNPHRDPNRSTELSRPQIGDRGIETEYDLEMVLFARAESLGRLAAIRKRKEQVVSAQLRQGVKPEDVQLVNIFVGPEIDDSGVEIKQEPKSESESESEAESGDKDEDAMEIDEPVGEQKMVEDSGSVATATMSEGDADDEDSGEEFPTPLFYRVNPAVLSVDVDNMCLDDADDEGEESDGSPAGSLSSLRAHRKGSSPKRERMSIRRICGGRVTKTGGVEKARKAMKNNVKSGMVKMKGMKSAKSAYEASSEAARSVKSNRSPLGYSPRHAPDGVHGKNGSRAKYTLGSSKTDNSNSVSGQSTGTNKRKRDSDCDDEYVDTESTIPDYQRQFKTPPRRRRRCN